MSSTPTSSSEPPQDMIATAASEATAAREGTDKIIELLTEGAGQVDPLAAIIDLLKLMNTKLDAILERLPSAPPQA